MRFATLREISLALRKPSPSVIGNTSIRAHTLALLIQLTAIPTSAEDLNNFLVEELSIPALGGKKKKSKKAAGKGLSVVDDGDSEEEGKGAEEDEDDMEGWFSDSDDEGGVRAGATAGEQRRAADKKAVGGLGSAARNASAPKRKRRTFHEALHSFPAQRAAFSAAWLDLLLPRRATSESALPKGALIGGELSLVQRTKYLSASTPRSFPTSPSLPPA